MQKLGFYYWFRVAMMCVSLIMVISIIYRMNNPGKSDILSWMGLPNSGAPKLAQVQLCPTRVSSISVIGKAAVFQESLRWYRTAEGTREELDPIAVEKWFSEYCTVKAEPAPTAPASTTPVMTLAYVAGLPVTVQRSEDGVYSWNGLHFNSAKLGEAIEALTALPVATHPGK